MSKIINPGGLLAYTTVQVIALLLAQLIAFCKNAQAQVFPGGFSPARVVQLRWSSATTPTYTSTYIAPAVNGWFGISSKVSFSQVSTGSYDISTITTTTASNGLYAVTSPSCVSGGKDTFGPICVNEQNWGFVQIAGYTNQMQNYNLNTTQIISSVWCHEFGHAVSLAHTDPSVIAVMRSGIISSYLPQALDKSNLRSKWGN